MMPAMRPCLASPLHIREAAFGGPKPLFCVPLVAETLEQLLDQAHVAHDLKPDVVEWRADSYGGAGRTPSWTRSADSARCWIRRR